MKFIKKISFFCITISSLLTAQEPGPKRQRIEEVQIPAAAQRPTTYFRTSDNQKIAILKNTFRSIPYIRKLIAFKQTAGQVLHEGQDTIILLDVSSTVYQAIAAIVFAYSKFKTQYTGQELIQKLVEYIQNFQNIGDYITELLFTMYEWQVDEPILNAIRIIIAKNISSVDEIASLQLPNDVIFSKEFFKNIELTPENFLEFYQYYADYIYKTPRRPAQQEINAVLEHFAQFLIANSDTVAQDKELIKFLTEERLINAYLKKYLLEQFSWYLPAKITKKFQDTEKKEIQALALSSDGKSIISSDQRDCVIWNIATGSITHRFRRAFSTTSPPSRLSITPNNNIVVAQQTFQSAAIEIFDLTTGQSKNLIMPDNASVKKADVLSNDHIISIATPGLYIWDLAKDQPVYSVYQQRNYELYDMMVRPDKKYVVVLVKDKQNAFSKIVLKLFKINQESMQLQEIRVNEELSASEMAQLLHIGGPEDATMTVLSNNTTVITFNFSSQPVTRSHIFLEPVLHLQKSVLTPNKKYLISIGVNPKTKKFGIIIHDVTTGKIAKIIDTKSGSGTVKDFAVASSGKSLFVSVDDHIDRYDLETVQSIIDILQLIKAEYT